MTSNIIGINIIIESFDPKSFYTTLLLVDLKRINQPTEISSTFLD